MSSEQSTELSAGVRRRIVALPTRAEAPVALIVRDAEQRDALTERLGRRRVVPFPSLAHFCTDEQRKQPWAGVVVGYPCAWDPQLEGFVAHRSCIALYQVPEDVYAWPEAVKRLEVGEQLDEWVADLFSPMPAWKKALEEERKRPRRPRLREAKPPIVLGEGELEAQADALFPSRQLELGIYGSNGASERTPSEGQAEKQAQATASQVASAPSEARAGTRRTRTGGRTGRPARAVREAQPRREQTVASPETRLRHRADLYKLGTSPDLHPRLERELVRLAGEIGLARAHALLQGLQVNAMAARARGTR